MRKNQTEENTLKKKKSKKVIVVVVVILVIIGAILGQGETPEIVWDDENQLGTVTFDLDGNANLAEIKYYDAITDFVNDLDKTTLKDYKVLAFVGQIKNDEDKMTGRIYGELPIEYIKNVDTANPYEIEENMTYLLLPDYLEE